MWKITCVLVTFCIVQAKLCSGQNQEQFKGVWRLDLASSIDVMSGNVRGQYDSLSAEIKTRASNSMTGRAFTFTDDSVYVDWNSRGQSKRLYGTWSFNNDQDELLVIIGDDQQRFLVSFRENGDLIIENKKPLGFFYRMYLRKE